MKFIISIIGLVTALTTSAQESCRYDIDLCKINQACIKTSTEKAECLDLPKKLPKVLFPLKAINGVYCDQGNLSPDGNSHTFNNTSFALDLTSNRDFSPAQIIASSEGQIISHSSCITKNDNCGGGFGNYVQILRNDGFMVFYAHLEKVYVKTGEFVRQGQAIGLEGNTGLTGKENRHLHFSVHFDWRQLGIDYLKKNVGHTPDSVPYKLDLCQSQSSSCTKSEIDSRDVLCRRTTNLIEWFNIQ